jgi:hypothetical protein
MYDYGCFAAFWSNFDLWMEAAICELAGRDPKENCALVNPKTSGGKQQMLKSLLEAAGRTDAAKCLVEVFEIAERNSWIHGHILNPNGDFSRLTRLRVEKSENGVKVTNSVVSFDISPFAGFYRAFQAFENASGITKEHVDNYLRRILQP